MTKKKEMDGFKPLNDLILIVRDARAKESNLMLITEEKSTTGVVIAVGPGLHGPHGRIPIDIQIGDRVVFDKIAGLTIEGKPYEEGSKVVIKESDVIATVDTGVKVDVKSKYGL